MYTAFIVDDDKYGLIDLQETMEWEKYGFCLKESFLSPVRALESILTYKPDVVFSDIKMPVMNGLDLIRMSMEQGYEGKYIIVSSYDDFKFAKEAIRYGVCDYCLKPLDSRDANQVLLNLKRKLDLEKSNSEETIIVPNDVMNEMTDYIDINLASKISLNQLCSEYHISASYCCKLFKKYFDKSLGAYILDRRMEHAKHLLRTTLLPIQNIAAKCGFDDYFYFAKKFKQYVKMTPSQYRNGAAKENDQEPTNDL